MMKKLLLLLGLSIVMVLAMASLVAAVSADRTRWPAGFFNTNTCGSKFLNGKYYQGQGTGSSAQFLNPSTNTRSGVTLLAGTGGACVGTGTQATTELFFATTAAGTYNTNTNFIQAYFTTTISPTVNKRSITGDESTGKAYVAGGQKLHEITLANGSLKTWDLSGIGVTGNFERNLVAMGGGKVAGVMIDAPVTDTRKLVVVDTIANTATVFSLQTLSGTVFHKLNVDSSGNVYGAFQLGAGGSTVIAFKFDGTTLTKYAVDTVGLASSEETRGPAVSGNVIMGLSGLRMRNTATRDRLWRIDTSTNVLTRYQLTTTPEVRDVAGGAADASGNFYHVRLGNPTGEFVQWGNFVP